MISVIVPIHNSENYLKHCLDSVLNQTFKDFELLLIDDGSTDNSGKMCDDYAEKDGRIRVHHKIRGGVSSARNKGLKLAKGDFICFIDSDDYIHPQMLEILHKQIADNECDIAICDRKKVNSPNGFDLLESAYDSNIYSDTEELLRKNIFKIFCTGRLYKREIINDTVFALNANRYEDVTFNIELITSNNLKVLFVTQKLYYYVNNEYSLTHTTTNDCQLPACEHLFKLYRDNKNVIHINYLLEYMVKSFLSLRYLMSLDNSSNENKLKCNSYIKEIYPIYRQESKNNKKMLMLLFLKSPFLYRIYRELQDPTLKDYKKQLKGKRKKEK